MVTGENNSKVFIKDSSFDDNQIPNYHLAIEVGKESISYCIIDPKKHRCILLYSKDCNIEELFNLFQDDAFITKKFSSKSISVINFPNTLVPKELYDEKDKEKLFELNHIPNDIILKDNLRNEIVNVYSIPKTLYQTINNLIPEAKLKAQSSILINNFLSYNQMKETMFLYIKDCFVNIIITKNEKLLFQNKFEYKTKEDLLFYVLFCIQQINLSNEEIKTIVFGSIKKEEFNILYDYIRNIEYGNKLKDISCGNEFNNIPEHCYNVLFRQYLCV